MQQVDFKLVQAMVADLRKPNQAHYFIDVLLCAIIGWAAFIYALAPNPLWLRLPIFLLAAVFLYRGLSFIHEIFHQQGMKLFRYLWHAVLGIPLLIPFLLYLPIHQEHHNKSAYGTLKDGEYENLKGKWGAGTTKLFMLNLLMPLVLLIRFAILPPLALIFPQIRDKVIPNFIHLAVRVPFTAPQLKESARKEAQIVEWCCCAWSWALIIISIWFGWTFFLALAMLQILMAYMNTIRALGATHLYVEQEEGRDARGQLLDSINVDSNGPLALILCPVGLRFHALHHIAPYLPYHSMPTAHRRLMMHLPKDSEYHYVTVSSLAAGIYRVHQATSP